MFNYLMNIKDVGEFLGGTAAITTVLFAIFTWVFSRISKSNSDKLMESNNQVYQKIIKKLESSFVNKHTFLVICI